MPPETLQSADPPPPTAQPLPPVRVRFWRRRWFRILALVSLLFSISLGIFIYRVTRPSNLARLTADLLFRMTGAKVDINSAYASSDGTIHLSGVRLRVPDETGPSGRFFDAREVTITQDMFQLLHLKFSPKKITVSEPSLFVIENAETEKYNYQLLQERLIARPDTEKGKLPKVLPEIVIEGGSVRFAEVVDGKYSELGRLNVIGNLTAKDDLPGVYDFKLEQFTEAGAAGAAIRGRLDLNNKMSVVGSLDNFSIESPQRVALPRRLQKWWDRLNPSGSLPTVSFGWDKNENGAGLYATLDLKDGEITLPYGDAETSMTSRMTHVNGRFKLNANSIQVENLVGQIEGLDYKLNGKINGFDGAAPLKLVVEIKKFKLPQQPKYLPALPQAIQHHFYRFTPSGVFRALVLVERKEQGGAIAYDGTVYISEAKASYAKFPYPVEDLHGELRFDDKHVQIVTMQGRGPTGATITVTGEISPPREGAGIHAHVTATDVPVDDYLRAAISPEQAAIIDVLQDKTTYDGLIAKGLIQSSTQKKERAERLLGLRQQLVEAQTHAKKAAQLQPTTQPALDALAPLKAQIAQLEPEAARPVFDLNCKASFSADVDRPEGVDSKYTTTVYIEAAGTTALIKQFPYPLQLTKGRVTVMGGRVTVDDVEAHGLTGATTIVSGVIEPGHEGGGRAPRLQIIIKNMPVDPLLANTVPEPHDRWLRDVHLSGNVDGIGVILRSPDAPPGTPIDFRFETALTKGRAQPYGGAYVIDNVTGKAVIEHGKVTLESIEGKHGSTTLSLSGESGTRRQGPETQPSDDAAPRTHIVVKADGLLLEDPIIDMLPPGEPSTNRIRALFEKHKPAGITDTQITIDAGGKSSALSCEVSPRNAAFDVDGRRIELTECKGAITYARGVAHLEHWKTKLGTGTVELHGDIQLADQPRVDVVLNAKNASIDPATRKSLPTGLVRFIDALKFDGGYELKDTTVTYLPPPDPTATLPADLRQGLQIKGKARLENAHGVVGFAIRDLAGDLDFDVSMPNLKDKMPHLDVKVNLDKFIAADRTVSPLSMSIVSGESTSDIVIKNITGDLYHGSIAGSGRIDVGEGGMYQVRLSISDADVGPIVYPLRYAEAKGNPKPDAEDSNFEALRKARLSASLDLKGRVDNPEKRSGRGRFDVTEVALNQSPLATAVIQIVNLSLPTGEGLNHALATFIVEDDTINFEHIQLDSPSFSFVGKGQMAYRAQTLDIDFLAQAKRKELVPLVAVWRLLLDQLINIHVSGTLGKPVAELRPLEGVRQGVDELIGKPQKDPASRSIPPNKAQPPSSPIVQPTP